MKFPASQTDSGPFVLRKEDDEMKKDEYGYDCACGKHHHYPPYVIAHQNDELIHTCECGRRNSILGLVATIGDLPENAEPSPARNSSNLRYLWPATPLTQTVGRFSPNRIEEA